MTQAYFYIKGYFPFFAIHYASRGKTDCIQTHYASQKSTKSHKTRNILHTFTLYWVYLVYYKL